MTEGSMVWVCVAGILIFAWMLSHLPTISEYEDKSIVQQYKDVFDSPVIRPDKSVNGKKVS